MRSFRNVAVASISALALTFSSTAVASAQTAIDSDIEDVTVVEQPVGTDRPSKGSSPSSDANEFLGLDGDQPADGTALFGSSKEGFGDQPGWAKLLYAGTVISGVGAVLATVIAPIYNFFTHGL